MTDIERVKGAAHGRWLELLAEVGGIDLSYLDGKHHPCPKCQGTDRFRVIDADRGAVLCNQCFREKNGDGLAALQWATGKSFREVLGLVARRVGIEPEPRKKRAGKQNGGLVFHDWNHSTVAAWTQKKPGVTPEAVRANGGQLAEWRGPDGNTYEVIAIPILSIQDKIQGWSFYNATGGDLPSDKGGAVKIRCTGGAKTGWIGKHGLEHLEGATVVWKVEGTSDMLALWSAIPEAARNDEVVISNPFGAREKPKREHLKALEGKTVVVVADRDPDGRSGGEKWSRAIAYVASEVRVLEVPGPGKDLRDWLSAGGTFENLRELALRADPIPPAETGAPPPDLYTDLSNARRLVHDHGSELRYVPAWSRWVVWRDDRWIVDESGAAMRLAKAVADAFLEGAGEDDVPKARRVQGEKRLRAMLSLAKSEPGIPVIPDDLDSDPWALGVRGGWVDLRDGTLHEPDLTKLLTKQAGAAFDPEARCPRWLQFVQEITQEDEELADYLQRVAGYCLTGDVRERLFFLLYGPGRNGKSVFLEIIRAMLGEYAVKTPVETLLAQRDRGPSNDIARLHGRRFVYAAESGEGRRLNESLVKDITGRETIVARYLYAEFFEFMPTFKLFLGTNHRPSIRGSDQAIWDRVRLIPFEARFEGEKEDKELPAKLLAELPGILRWAVDGCLAWQEEGLGCPERVRLSTEEYRSEQDDLGTFVEEKCVRVAGASVQARDLYQTYRQWAEGAGTSPMSERAFGERIHGKGFERKKDRAGRRVYQGIGLISDTFPDDAPSSSGNENDCTDHPPSPSVSAQDDGGTEGPGGSYVNSPYCTHVRTRAQDEGFTENGPSPSVPPSSAVPCEDDNRRPTGDEEMVEWTQ